MSTDRRDFLKTTAAVGAAMTLTAASYDRVSGANGTIGVGFVGVGGRCQAHLDVVNKLAKDKKGVAARRRLRRVGRPRNDLQE